MVIYCVCMFLVIYCVFLPILLYFNVIPAFIVIFFSMVFFPPYCCTVRGNDIPASLFPIINCFMFCFEWCRCFERMDEQVKRFSCVVCGRRETPNNPVEKHSVSCHNIFPPDFDRFSFSMYFYPSVYFFTPWLLTLFWSPGNVAVGSRCTWHNSETHCKHATEVKTVRGSNVWSCRQFAARFGPGDITVLL